MQCYAKQGRKGGTQGNATIKTGIPCKYYRIFQVKFSTKKSVPNALGIPSVPNKFKCDKFPPHDKKMKTIMYAYLVGSRVKWVAFTLAQCGANFDSRTPTTLMRCGQRQTVATIFTTFNQCFIHPGKISNS